MRRVWLAVLDAIRMNDNELARHKYDLTHDDILKLCSFLPSRVVVFVSWCRRNVGLALRLMAKQVEVANADQDRVNELATKPGLAALHRDLKVRC